MSLIIDLPDLDDSASTLGVVTPQTVAGFPTENMWAQYLLQDGNVGDTPTSILDTSGNNHTGALFSSSNITRTAQGMTTGASVNRGFMFDTGLDITNGFTLIWVARNRNAANTPNSRSVMAAAACNVTGGASMGSSILGTSVGHGTIAPTYSDTETVTYDFAQLLNFKTNGSTKWDATSSAAPNLLGTGFPKNQWSAFGLSVDPAGTVIFRGLGSTITFNGGADLTTWLSTGVGNLLLGLAGYQTNNYALGDMGLAVVYGVPTNDVPTIDNLLTIARTNMGSRGVTPA